MKYIEYVVDVLVEAGHGTMSMNTLKTLLFFYNMGPSTLDEVHRQKLEMKRKHVIDMLRRFVIKDLLKRDGVRFDLHDDIRSMLNKMHQ